MDRFRLLSPEDFAAALADERKPCVVDVRAAENFVLGHVPGSVNIPVHDLGKRRDELPGRLAERILVIGDDRKRTAAGATFLALMGFGDVSLLDGGIAAYDGPIEKGLGSPPPQRGPNLRVVPPRRPQEDKPPS